MATGVTSTRLVGRSLELAQLQAALADAASGQPSLAFIVGESGVGKSRLVAELQVRAAADGARVLHGDCVELGDGELAYAPLVTALRPLVRDADPVLAALPADMLAELATLFPGLGEARERARGAGDQARVFEALLAVVDGLSRTAPVLLVIEDLHWADASTRAFLRFLAATLGDERVLLVATYRPDELHRRHPLRPLLAELERVRALRIDLAGLTHDELGEQLADILGKPPDAALVDRLYARSEGNPLFTEELLAAGTDGLGAVPPSLAAALALRIERLGDDAQEIVRVLSAGGPQFLDDSVLADVSGLEGRALRDALREAVANHIVVLEGDRYTLRHALLREAVHDELLPGERAELHRALARALEREAADAGRPSAQSAAAIAHHYLAAGDQPAALAAAVRAGIAAMDVQAYGEGAALFERALELWDRVPDAKGLSGTDEAELLERASACSFYADELARSVTLARRALALVDEDAAPRRAAWLYGMLQRSLWAMLRADDSVAAIERGLGLLADDEPSPERAGLLAQHAKMLMLQSRYRRAVSVARRALREQAELEEPGGYHLDEAGALNALGVSLSATGQIEEGAAALRRALELATERGHLQDMAAAAANLSEALHRVGRTREALEVARATHAQLGSLPTRQLWLTLAIAQYSFDAGDWEAAEAALAGVARRRFSSGHSELNSCLRHAELALGRDEREAARAQLARAEELAVDSREPQYLGVLGALQADLGMRDGDVAAARAAVDEALDRIEFCSDDALRMAMVSAAGLAAEATAAQHARDLGDEAAVAAALGHAELLIARVRACAEDGGPLEHAHLAHAEADNCRALDTDQTGRWAEAAARWDALGRPYPAAVACWRHAEALVAAGDREAASPVAAAAIEIAERLGAAWLAGELESLTARARLRLGEPGEEAAAAGEDESDDPFGLTPRERQVLALVAAGATNREIGRQLYMAEKTASVHVSRILSKLDVRSRTEAAGVAHRLGLDAVV
ncbi:MAG TPA: AAA family ATPase [Solirubrobacteraceae bacterium]|nr:AAA family ATPase [Solirubrobacteraceae bacterium]